MLHADELMVGDYVTFSDVQNDSNCPKLKVFIIGNGDVYVSVDGDPVLDLCDSKDLSGIPLTPEILEKNGFDVSDPEVSIYRFEEDGKAFRFCLRRMYNKDNRPNGYSFYAFNVLAIIDFVHQLQHCFKLVGIDKDIVL